MKRCLRQEVSHRTDCQSTSSWFSLRLIEIRPQLGYDFAVLGIGVAAIDLAYPHVLVFRKVHRLHALGCHARKRSGVNAIPEALADEVGERLCLPVDSSIVQTNIVGHTGASGFARLARQAPFSGPVEVLTTFWLTILLVKVEPWRICGVT